LSLFITFEGGEGCGKNTQAHALWKKLYQRNILAMLTHARTEYNHNVRGEDCADGDTSPRCGSDHREDRYSVEIAVEGKGQLFESETELA